ncbi:hypothetical protein ACLM5H_18870 [Fredinandcohnia humi]
MVRIFSIVENEQMISIFDSVFEDTNYEMEWLAHEAKLYERLRESDKAIVFLPESYVYNIYSLCLFLKQHTMSTKVVLVFNKEDDIDSAKALMARADEVIILEANDNEIQEDIMSTIESYQESFKYRPLVAK